MAQVIDCKDDPQDQADGRRIKCPLLAIWSGEGGLENWYAEQGGPLAIWRQWTDSVESGQVKGGHFFPEEHPEDTAATLSRFFAA